MNQQSVDGLLDMVIGSIARALESRDFERRGRSLKIVSDRMAGIIEFQRSDTSSDDRIIFTINVGVVCGDLLDSERTDIGRSSIVDAHLRTRLGALLDTPNDMWWELNAISEADALTTELLELLVSKAVPFLERHMNEQALVALWESGRSPGLTAVQRARFLSELKSEH